MYYTNISYTNGINLENRPSSLGSLAAVAGFEGEVFVQLYMTFGKRILKHKFKSAPKNARKLLMAAFSSQSVEKFRAKILSAKIEKESAMRECDVDTFDASGRKRAYKKEARKDTIVPPTDEELKAFCQCCFGVFPKSQLKLCHCLTTTYVSQNNVACLPVNWASLNCTSNVLPTFCYFSFSVARNVRSPIGRFTR